MVLAGEGIMLFEGGALPVRRGDEIFLPCGIPGAALEGEFSVFFGHPEGAEISAVNPR
jgi:hypothetical protein